MAENIGDIKNVTNELVRRTNEVTRRLRIMEQRADRIETHLADLEEKAITQMGDLKISLERIGSKISAVSDRLTAIESEISRINKGMGKTANKSEIKQLETYIELINPITSKFVTKDELERAFEEKLKLQKKA